MSQPTITTNTTKGEQSSLVVSLDKKSKAAREKAELACRLLEQEVQEAIFTRRSSRKSTDPYVARLRTIAMLYQELLASPEEEDHHVLEEPYFGKLSLVDLLSLLEGDEEHNPGLATLDHEGYGIILPTAQGWCMVLDGENFSLRGDMAHDLLYRNLSCQNAPYVNPGVLPTRDWKAHYDGITAVIPPRDFTTRDGEECEVREPIRLSLYHERYAALVWSVAHSRYGLEEFRYHGEVTQRCFGTQRVPENALESSFWHDNFVWHKYSNEEQEKFFLPGRPFDHLSPRALDDFEVYANLYTQSKKNGRL